MTTSSPHPPQQQWTADTTKGHDSLIEPDNKRSGDSLSATRDTSVELQLQPLEIQAPKSKKTPLRRYIKLIFYLALFIAVSAPWIKMSVNIYKLGEDEPNPPIMPDSMVVFYPPRNEHETQQMQALLDTYSDPILTWEEFANKSSAERVNHPEFTHTSANHFSSKRIALLFTPGTYPADVQIGYYTSLYGLGSHPDDVTFSGPKGPHCPALDKFTDRPPNGSGLNSFWRSVENVATKPKNGMTWAVSQAAPLRRMHIHGDLNLYDADSWVSGGFGGNIQVDGAVNFGGQQQWMMRNVHMETISGGAWSLVFVGCTGGVPNETKSIDETGPLISTENEPMIVMEKPYITLKKIPADDNRGNVLELQLRVPNVKHGKNVTGPHFINDEQIRDFHRVKLAIPSTNPDAIKAAFENHSTIQNALNHGKDIVLSPGIYRLSSSLEVKHSDQVILGLGYASLIAPADGSPCIYVHSKVSGVRIASVMLEASVLNEEVQTQYSSLLEWGERGVVDNGDDSNPGLLSDVFARVGGSSLDRNVSTNTMIVLHSGNIICDNLWLWRADHAALRPGEQSNFPGISPLYHQTKSGECQVKNGLVVYGANVIIFGLAVEHTTEDQVIWLGEGGVVYFYQSELPYDVDRSYALGEYVGYRVNGNVTHHAAQGIGIYSNFRDHDVNVATAVMLPEFTNIKVKNLFTVKLDNKGSIKSIVNGLGPGPTEDTERGIPRRCLSNSCTAT